MDTLAILVVLMACSTMGTGLSITVANEDLHLMVKTGSPDVTFNADVVPGADTPVSRDLQFIMGPKVIAHPSNKPGAVMEIDATYQNHFEILQTTLPRVSIKLNNPVMKIHTQVFKWASHANSSIYVEVPLIVSDAPELSLPNEINENDDTEFQCNVTFGYLPGKAEAEEKIEIVLMIADDRVLDPIGESQTEITPEAVVTRVYSYNHTFKAHENGKTLTCEAHLQDFPEHKVITAQQLNVLYLPSEGISFGEIPHKNEYIVGEQINCSAGGNPGPENYQWTDLANTTTQVHSQILNLTEAMVATLQFWMCEASYASGLYVNASIQFSVVPVVDPSNSSTSTVVIAVAVSVTVLVIIICAIILGVLIYKRKRHGDEAAPPKSYRNLQKKNGNEAPPGENYDNDPMATPLEDND